MNRASRVASKTPSGMVLATARAWGHATQGPYAFQQRAVEAEELGEFEMKGVAGPMSLVWCRHPLFSPSSAAAGPLTMIAPLVQRQKSSNDSLASSSSIDPNPYPAIHLQPRSGDRSQTSEEGKYGQGSSTPTSITPTALAPPAIPPQPAAHPSLPPTVSRSGTSDLLQRNFTLPTVYESQSVHYPRGGATGSIVNDSVDGGGEVGRGDSVGGGGNQGQGGYFNLTAALLMQLTAANASHELAALAAGVTEASGVTEATGGPVSASSSLRKGKLAPPSSDDCGPGPLSDTVASATSRGPSAEWQHRRESSSSGRLLDQLLLGRATGVNAALGEGERLPRPPVAVGSIGRREHMDTNHEISNSSIGTSAAKWPLIAQGASFGGQGSEGIAPSAVGIPTSGSLFHIGEFDSNGGYGGIMTIGSIAGAGGSGAGGRGQSEAFRREHVPPSRGQQEGRSNEGSSWVGPESLNLGRPGEAADLSPDETGEMYRGLSSATSIHHAKSSTAAIPPGSHSAASLPISHFQRVQLGYHSASSSPRSPRPSAHPPSHIPTTPLSNLGPNPTPIWAPPLLPAAFAPPSLHLSLRQNHLQPLNLESMILNSGIQYAPPSPLQVHVQGLPHGTHGAI